MEIIEALGTLYKNSNDKLIFTDTKLNTLWRNNDDLPEFIFPDKIMLSRSESISLPVTEYTVCRYVSDDHDFTLRITPMFENDELAGYLMHFLSEYEVDKIAMQSTLKSRLRKEIDNIRFQAGSIISLLNEHKKAWEQNGDPKNSDFDMSTREKVLNIMSATSNYEEVSRYLGDNVISKPKFMSVALDDLAKRIKCRADELGYDFDCEIRSMVHAEMNVERFEAAVSNLVVNAYMYNSKTEKKCKIILSSDGEEIKLTVEDNGDGIPEEKLAKLQRPLGFFDEIDLNESLGLTVVMLYCDRFGGKLDIETKADEYTRVTMTFKDNGLELPREFRQYLPPMVFTLDNTGCILGKGFGYYNDDMYNKK